MAKAVVFSLMLAGLVSCGDVIDKDEVKHDTNTEVKIPGDYSILKALYEVVDLKEAYKELGLVFSEGPGLSPAPPLGDWELRNEYEAKVRFYEDQMYRYLSSSYTGFTGVSLVEDLNFPYLMFRFPIMNILRETGNYTFVQLPPDFSFMGWVNEEAIGPDGKSLRFDTLSDLIQGALLADLYRGLPAETITAMLRDPTPQS